MAKTGIIEINGELFGNQRIASEIVGVRQTTLIDWGKGKNPPPRDPVTKQYPLKKLGEWIRSEMPFKTGAGGGHPYMIDLDRLPGRITQGDLETTLDKNAEETRLKRLQADKQEIDNMERAGNLVSADDVRTAGTKSAIRIKTRFSRFQ